MKIVLSNKRYVSINYSSARRTEQNRLMRKINNKTKFNGLQWTAKKQTFFLFFIFKMQAVNVFPYKLHPSLKRKDKKASVRHGARTLRFTIAA